jgi:hypothetical protein
MEHTPLLQIWVKAANPGENDSGSAGLARIFGQRSSLVDVLAQDSIPITMIAGGGPGAREKSGVYLIGALP